MSLLAASSNQPVKSEAFMRPPVLSEGAVNN
jgi:hypothetical protein